MLGGKGVVLVVGVSTSLEAPTVREGAMRCSPTTAIFSSWIYLGETWEHVDTIQSPFMRYNLCGVVLCCDAVSLFHALVTAVSFSGFAN